MSPEVGCMRKFALSRTHFACVCICCSFLVVLTDMSCRFSCRVRFVYIYSGPSYGPVVVVDKGSVSQNQKSQESLAEPTMLLGNSSQGRCLFAARTFWDFETVLLVQK